MMWTVISSIVWRTRGRAAMRDSSSRPVERGQVGEREQYAPRAGGEQQLGGERHAAMQALEVGVVERLQHVGLAVEAHHDAPLGVVVDQGRRRQHVVVARHLLGVLRAETGQRRGQQARRNRGVADQDALAEEVMDVERLVRADPGVDALVEDADALGVRMRVQPAPDGPREQAAAPQDARASAARPRPARPAARAPRSGRAAGRRRPTRRPRTPTARGPRHSTRSTRASVSSAAPAASGARHLGHVHGLLGARRTAERAVVEADAAPHVARRTRQRPAERLGAAHEEMRVAAEGVLVVRLDVEDALGRLEVGLHAARAESREPELALPALEHGLRRAPRHAAVDHRRATDAASLGEDDRRVAEDHRRARVAVEAADHRRRVGGEALGAVQRAFLEQEHVEAGVAQPGGGGRAPGARADDDRVRAQHLVTIEACADR